MCSVPWYRKVYHGSKAHSLWQIAVGSTVFFSVIVMPMAVKMLKPILVTKQVSKRPVEDTLVHKVYLKRLQMRAESGDP